MSRSHFLEPALAAGGGWGLRIVHSGTWLARFAELAGTSASRRAGLVGREALPPGHALVIAPTQGIHTFGMRFSLDIVGVARDGTVVKIKENVPGRRVVLALRAFAIVELAAGAAQAAGLRAGDRLEFGATR
jgi:uncharacterized membrane protein (UPF0127 family)